MSEEVKAQHDEQVEEAKVSVGSPADQTEPAVDAEPAAPEDSGDEERGSLADQLERTKARLEELEAENSTLKDQYLRKQADFENYRKRMQREKQETATFANQQILLDLTSIIDDFERAINSAEESRDYDAFHNGVALIEKQLTGTLERKWGLTRFDSLGEEFDPQRHEAVTSEAVEGAEVAKVLEEYQKGYLLGERVLRSAKVKVSTPQQN